MAVKMSDATHERFYDVEIAATASPSDQTKLAFKLGVLRKHCIVFLIFLMQVLSLKKH